MKKIASLVLLTLHGIMANAQSNTTLNDDLFPEKNKVLSKYLPMYEQNFSSSFYMMPVAEVKQKLATFKEFMQPKINGQSNAALKTLMQKDVDFTVRETMRQLVSLYGMDSVGMKNLSKIMIEKKTDPNFMKYIMEAQTKVFVKNLPREEQKKLLDEIYKAPELNNEALFKKSAAYRSWINNYINHLRNSKYKNDTTLGPLGTPVVKLKIVNAEFSTGFIKDYLTFQFSNEVLKIVPDKRAKENAYQNFMASVSNPEYRKNIETTYRNYMMMEENALSPDFNFEDINGKKVALKSLRGKYVYIDVWATWCVPCLAEIPSLKNLEHDFKEKNIHFVSLSVDRLADKAKWASYVKNNKLGGIQVFSDKSFNADFVKKFNINAIPRFILIDPNGKIVSGEANRPSDPKLRAQFNQLLK